MCQLQECLEMEEGGEGGGVEGFEVLEPTIHFS